MDNQVAASSYPTSLTGSLDPGMSRWLWLVKWLLAIPHVVVLAEAEGLPAHARSVTLRAEAPAGP